MHNILSDISTWSVLKWIIIVLVAGFIGQFGKSMAQTIIAKIRLARVKKEDVKDIDLPKAAATEVKPPDPVIDNSHSQFTGKVETPDKKTLKILAKQEKKAAKLAKKAS
jgi:hypothetical protein